MKAASARKSASPRGSKSRRSASTPSPRRSTTSSGSTSIRARAKDSPFGGTIAHGFLTLSLLSHLSERTFGFTDRKMGVNYGLNRVRFTAPLPSGSRVRARFTLQKYEKLAEGGVQVTWNTVVERRRIGQAGAGRRVARAAITTNEQPLR